MIPLHATVFRLLRATVVVSNSHALERGILERVKSIYKPRVLGRRHDETSRREEEAAVRKQEEEAAGGQAKRRTDRWDEEGRRLYGRPVIQNLNTAAATPLRQ